MKRWVVFFSLIVVGASAAHAQTSPREPFEILRSLRNAEDDFMRGSEAGKAARAQALDDYSARVQSAPYSIWNREKNRWSIVSYLLSGGDAEIMRPLIETFPNGSVERQLMDGALAYAFGQEKEAEKFLRSIDAKKLPGEIGAQVAFVQGSLMRKADPQQALKNLDLARLLAPGALVEEAALRQQMFIASESDDVERFSLVAKRYLSRFATSPFVDNFFPKFRTFFVRKWLFAKSEERVQLETILETLEPRDRAKLYLLLARETLIRGDMISSLYAAKHALDDANNDPMLIARASVYTEAVDLFADRGLRSTEALESINVVLLSLDEKALRESALLLAREVRATSETQRIAKEGVDTPLMAAAADVLKKANLLARSH